MTGVIIGIDRHKGSHTAVVLDGSERKLGQLRVRATPAQVDQLQRWAAAWPDRTWAVEGARGLGHLLAQQVLARGERVVDVQPTLAARVRLLNTGAANKNDPNDARSVAVAAVRTSDLRKVVAEDQTAVTQIRFQGTIGRTYYDRKVGEGMGHKSALRALKRPIGDAVYARLVADAKCAAAAPVKDPGGQSGNDSVSSVAGSHPEQPDLRTSHSRAEPQPKAHRRRR